MKRLVCLAVVSALLLGGGYAVYKYSGARGKVAKQELLDKIDDLLGKDKVRQQEIADQLDKANQAVEILFDGRVREQVRVERLTKELQTAKAKFDASDKKLAEAEKALTSVKADATYEIALGEGVSKATYSQKNVDDLKKLVTDRTQTFTTSKKAFTDKEAALEAAERSFKVLRNQEQDARQKVAIFEARKKALDEKLAALAKQQEAAKLLKAGKSTIVTNFDELEKSLSDLEDSAEVQFRKAEEHSAINAENSLKASKGGEDIDDVLRAAREARGEK